MAGEVSPQEEGNRTLHLRALRKQWQIITLQIIATVALVWMYMEIVSTYVVGSIDHTILFRMLEQEIGSELPVGDWLTGLDQQGVASYYVPIGVGLTIGGGMSLLAFQPPKRQQKIKLAFVIGLIVILSGRFLMNYLWQLWGEGWTVPDNNALATLEWPLLMILSMVILMFYLLPVIMGTRGIWGLSRKGVAWCIGFVLLFLAIHAILSFPVVKAQLGGYGDKLATLDVLVGAPTVGFFGMNLVTEQQFSLIMIACLIMIFQESAFGVIRQLEYAFRLPESCKRDPEYVKQVDNVLNGHLRHTVIFLTITTLSTMVALGFHSVLLEFVEGVTGSQWAAQVSESVELTLTYGLVISALLFLALMGVLRFFVPWQRLWGLIETSLSRS
ncbi:MAG: hypothetical protein CMP10_08420 [Zetaproteobacteria bacterium]|nr:hypothetical protein [Pseudobdellovibrionaceae bacterium]